MATAAVLGAAPTLTSVAGSPGILPARLAAGALSSDIDGSSIHHKKRSIQTKYLESMMDYTLNIWPNGTVGGVKTSSNSSKKYAVVEFVTFWAITTNMRVEIRGVESQMWLCMDKTGALYGSRVKSHDCIFYEENERINRKVWYSYYSVRHPSNTDKTVKWYIALNRRGRPRIAVTAKHKSSRFQTKSTTDPNSRPTINPEDLPSKPSSKKNPRYTRVRPADPTRPGRRNPRMNSRNQRKQERISDIFSSIEKSLYKNPLKVDSNSDESLRDSLLIDLGGNNPLINIDTGDDIRHSTKKLNSGRRKTYRRKQS